jgi:cbb3-type cytochrome oxidase subunit 1
MMSHHNIINNLLEIAKHFAHSDDTNIVDFCPYIVHYFVPDATNGRSINTIKGVNARMHFTLIYTVGCAHSAQVCSAVSWRLCWKDTGEPEPPSGITSGSAEKSRKTTRWNF